MEVVRAVRRSGPLLLVVVLVLLISAVALVSGPQVTRLPMPDATFREPAPAPAAEVPSAPGLTPTAPGVADPGEPASWLGILTLVVGGLLAAGIGVVLWYLLKDRMVRLRRPGGPPDVTHDAAADDSGSGREVRSAVQAGIDELDDDSADARRAVIACWLRLETLAAAAGTPRDPGDTPADLVGRLLTTHRVGSVALHRFADLYRRARYAPGDVDAHTRSEARATLVRLRTELTSSEPAPAGASDAASDAGTAPR